MQIHRRVRSALPRQSIFSQRSGHSSGWFHTLSVICLIACTGVPACSGQTPDLTQKSLEDLMNIDVTSVSKKEQKTSQVAAAVFVITPEDIRRSGALNIPDLLRMVPGLDVAQMDGGKWAISARGFNGQYSNKLLVLVDGRTVYTPTFAGVYWDSQNIPLDSIERIEVIRGPGAAVWGANAVNGVINIITKSADTTQGGSLSASNGNAMIGPETVRYGGKARGIGAYRVDAEGFHVGSKPTPTGANGQDDWRLIHGGFRTDTTLSAKDSLLTEGEAYQGDAGEMVFVPVSLSPPENATLALRDRYSGWNLFSRWSHSFSPQSATVLQVYFDRLTRGDQTYGIGQNTLDIDFQHHLAWGARQDIVWGGGYRISADGTIQTLRITFWPQDSTRQLFSLFAQDEIAVRPDRILLSIGARLEHNYYTGFNVDPSARLVWTADNKNMFWAAVSVAHRTPSRVDSDVQANIEVLPGPQGLPLLVGFLGNPNETNERLTAFDAGYRNALTSSFSLDTAAFYNHYSHLNSEEPGATTVETNPPPTHLDLPVVIGNGLYGETNGVESSQTGRLPESGL